MKPNNIQSLENIGYKVTYPYLENDDIEFFRASLSFSGEIKYKPLLDRSIEDLLLYIYNPMTLEYSLTDFQIDGEYLYFEVKPGYTKFLICDKSVDLDSFLLLINNL